VLLHYGDHPMIEPGELFLLVILRQDGATQDAWRDEHFDRLEDFRARPDPGVRPPWAPDLATLDALITPGIAASRAEGARWAVARLREQPAYAHLSQRAREPGGPRARADLDRAVLDQLQNRLDGQVRAHFPEGGVQRVALLERGDDPSVEPGGLVVRVFIDEARESPRLPA
jgi:hypothetical protein